jgi:hypothetical protein
VEADMLISDYSRCEVYKLFSYLTFSSPSTYPPMRIFLLRFPPAPATGTYGS